MASRNHKIFEGLVRSYHADLFRYAIFLCHNDQIAIDLVQEVYLRAWKNIKQLKDVSAAKSWLFTILSRENARCYQKKRPHILNIDEIQEIESSVQQEDLHQKHQLQSAMLELKVEYQEPILLQILGGFSTSEISSILSLNENTVSTRLFRARHQLKNIFDGQPGLRGNDCG